MERSPLAAFIKFTSDIDKLRSFARSLAFSLASYARREHRGQSSAVPAIFRQCTQPQREVQAELCLYHQRATCKCSSFAMRVQRRK